MSEVRHALTKYNGSLGTKGSVSHLFKKVGILTVIDTTEDDLINLIDDVEILDYEQVVMTVLSIRNQQIYLQ